MNVSSSPDTAVGFIVHSFTRTIRGVSTLCLVGRCADHRTFAVLLTSVRPSFRIRATDLARVRDSELHTFETAESALRTLDGESCVELSFNTESLAQAAADGLRQLGVRTYEADVDTVDAYLMNRGIHGSMTISGASQPGRHVDMVFLDPVLSSAAWQPELSVLSMDIETTREGEVFAISCHLTAPWLGEPVQEVLYTGMRQFGESALSVEGSTFAALRFESERELLAAFFARVGELDPDVITGWNVIDFDWQRLSSRAAELGVGCRVGRSDEQARFLPAGRRGGWLRPSSRKSSEPSRQEEGDEEDAAPAADSGAFTTAAMFIPGRQVIDGIRLLRYGPQNFSAQSLEHVANVVLGTGKTITAESSGDKVAEIDRLKHEDPEALCRYCLHDSVLVTRILEKTGLLALTVARCQLIGVSLSRAWMSIRSFDFIYIEALHRRGYAAPTLGVDALPLDAAPGGAILTPMPGLFRWVMVFDFKSLYPSVIRTFNIDPVTLIRGGGNGQPDGTADLITAPNGARFSREPGILPELLDRFFRKREEAKRRGDAVASFVYKIIMNSFYGVLGAGGCRFAGSDLAGAITSLGQRVLRWCRKLLIDMGYQVIYGDTDSLFVIAKAGEDEEPSSAAVRSEGAALAKTVNRRLSNFVKREYGVQPRLELEFEKVYERFFVPALRSPSAGDGNGRTAAVRGRAKGYAGLRALPAEESEAALAARIEVKGMEAIRRDWTPLAQELQLMILEELFASKDAHESALALSARIRALIYELREGRLDDRIIYTRALRKSVSQYTRSQPPHVKAALLLPPAERRGMIRYIMTVDGPQPVQRRTSTVDYDHYVEKQLRPIAQAFVDTVGPEVVEALNLDRQLPLFGG